MAKFKSSATATPARKPAPSKKAATKPATKAASKASPALKKKASAKPAAALDLGTRGIMDSAQQIWQTSVKALGRAQQEGTRLFETLVKEGAGMEKKTRSLAAGKVNAVRDTVRDSVENRVDQVKERATDTWDRLEKVFEERVQRALTRLGVPAREELQSLIERVDELNARLRNLAAQPSPSAAATPATPKAVVKQAAKKVRAPVKAAAKASPKPASSKPTSSKSQSPKPAAPKSGTPAAKKSAKAKPAVTSPATPTSTASSE